MLPRTTFPLLRLLRLALVPATLALCLAGCANTVAMREIKERQDREIQELQNRLDEKTRAATAQERQSDAEMRGLKKQLAAAQEEAGKARLDRADLERQAASKIPALEAALQTAAADKTRLADESAKTATESKRLADELAKRAQEMQARDKSLESTQADLRKKTDEQKILAAQLEKAQTDLAAAQAKLQQIEKEKQDLSGNLEEHKKNLESAKADAAKASEAAKKKAESAAPGIDAELKDAFVLLQNSLKPLADQNYASVSLEESRGVVVRLSADYLFEKDSVKLDKAAYPTLERIADIFKRYSKKYMEVQGHTDSDPVVNLPFEDNWGLAGERANKVVRFMTQEKGVSSAHIKSVSCSQSRPAPKSAGLGSDRRVEIILSNTP